jgi:hypothetical protein
MNTGRLMKTGEAPTIAKTCGKLSNTLVDRTSAALAGMRDPSASLTGVRVDREWWKLGAGGFLFLIFFEKLEEGRHQIFASLSLFGEGAEVH